jgi:N-methylhydantoinase A
VDAAVRLKLAEPLGRAAKAIAIGIRDIVNESMADATRVHLAEKGRDPRDYSLLAFGGAGPVHAYALAKLLRVKRLIVPLGAGVMSAFGFLVAAPTVDEVRGFRAPLRKVDWPVVRELYEEMETRARTLLRHAGGENEAIMLTRSADMRYIGQGFEIEVPLPGGALAHDQEDTIRRAFNTAYHDLFGRTEESVQVEVISWRLVARLRGQTIGLARSFAPAQPKRGEREVYFNGFGECRCAVYDRYALRPGTKIDGPAVFEERESSFIVGPDCTVTVDPDFNLIAEFQPAVAPPQTGSGP